MPAGQAHTIWFPELKEILEDKWNSALTISQQFELLAELNNKLNQIRKDLDIQPPMMWCDNAKRNIAQNSEMFRLRLCIMHYKDLRFAKRKILMS